MKQLLLITIPKAQKKTCYNIAAKVGVKISIHTKTTTAQILIIVEKDLLNCNLYALPEQMRGIYWFFDELRHRQFEYKMDVYTLDYKETRKRNEWGLFDLKQLTL